jgi:hypothetical protein
MPRHHAHVDVTVHSNRHGGHHHHHHHGHGHGAGVGMIVGAAAVGAVAGAAVASSSSHNRGYAAPRTQETVVVVGQPGYIASQPVYVAPQPHYQTTTTTVVAAQPGYAPAAAYGYGQPAYAAPQPAYIAPQPAYIAPQPAYIAPQPHYDASYSVHTTTVSAPPVYAAPAHTTVVVTTTPIRANHLGKKWNHGNVICLHSLASRQNLRIHNGFVDGNGGQGQWAQFIVERTGPERVKLRCVGMNSYLRCPGPHHLDHGPGGPQCEFWIVKHGKRGGEPVYSLESTQHPGCYVGVHDNGSIKPPMNTGLGSHGSFLVRVQRFGF